MDETISKFNLIDEKWIYCKDLHGNIEKYSIRELIRKSAELSEISNDNPLVNGAIYRILIAMLYRVLKGPKNDEEWRRLWSQDKFTQENLNQFDNYFEEFYDKFYLFDNNYPFYQVAGLESNEEANASKLAIYFTAGNNATLFDHHYDLLDPKFPYDEAARLLIAYHNFSAGGLTSYYIRNGRRVNIRSAQSSPLSRAALILIKGNTIYKTLLLNTVVYDVLNKPNDLPIWEKQEIIEPTEKVPTGRIDWLTWQAKSILLIPDFDKECVNKVIIAPGYNLPSNIHRSKYETMVAFRKVDTARSDPYPAIQFSEERVIWRNLNSLLTKFNADAPSSKTIEQYANFEFEDINPLILIGIISDRSKYKYIKQEELPIKSSAINNEQFFIALNEVLETAETGEKALNAALWVFIKKSDPQFSTKENLRRDDNDKINKRIKGLGILYTYWSLLGIRFKKLLIELYNIFMDDEKVDTLLDDWSDFVRIKSHDLIKSLYKGFQKNALTLKAISDSNATFLHTWNK